jgi:threonine synthase
MDVGAPSNFERLIALPEDQRPLGVELVDDATIRARIAAEYARSHYVWDPHSATAAEAYVRMEPADRARRTWIAAGTAHPYKFAEIVEPAIGRAVEPPAALAAILGRKAHKQAIAPDSAAFEQGLRQAFG